MQPEAAKTRASEPAGASSCGVLKNQAVHSQPETGLYNPFLSLRLDTGLQAMNRPEVCSPTDEQIVGNVPFVINHGNHNIKPVQRAPGSTSHRCLLFLSFLCLLAKGLPCSP